VLLFESLLIKFLVFTRVCSVWMSQCANKFRSGAANGGVRADLLALFHKLARLLRSPTQVLVVFDGPERASVKRGHLVRKAPHYLTAELQWLLECFGFSWYTVSHL
jgi:Holliday junction resolvase YEN1